MKKILIAIVFFATVSPCLAQTVKDSSFTIRISGYYDIGIFPFGYKSIPVKSDTYLSESELPYVFGLSISPLPWIGLVGEWHGNQNFRADNYQPGPYVLEWIPFYPPKASELTNVRLLSFETFSRSLNIAIQVGGDVTDKFAVFGRIGMGTTWHDYSFSYNDGQHHYVEGKTKTDNFQFSFVTSYFPVKSLGFTHSFSISENLPVWRMGIVGRFDFKAKK